MQKGFLKCWSKKCAIFRFVYVLGDKVMVKKKPITDNCIGISIRYHLGIVQQLPHQTLNGNKYFLNLKCLWHIKGQFWIKASNLGPILVNKVLQKWQSTKGVINLSCAPDFIFFIKKQDWKRVSDLNREFKYYFSNSIKSIIDRKKGSKLLITDFMEHFKNTLKSVLHHIQTSSKVMQSLFSIDCITFNKV